MLKALQLPSHLVAAVTAEEVEVVAQLEDVARRPRLRPPRLQPAVHVAQAVAADGARALVEVVALVAVEPVEMYIGGVPAIR